MATSGKTRFDVGVEDLQTFVAVAERGSFSGAAQQLNLSQPSISNRIRRLEEKLGVQLLTRTTRRVGLTERGERLFTEASELLHGLEALLREFDSEAAARDREVRVAATVMVATIAMPPLLARFHAAHRSIALSLHDLSPDEAVAQVADGRCDLAVMALTEARAGIAFEPLVRDACVVVTQLGHPLLANPAARLADVLRYPLLSPSNHVGLRRAIMAAADARGLSVRLAPEALGVGNVMTLLAMAAAGLGVCIHPCSFVPPELTPTIGIVPLADAEIVRTFGIVTAERRTLPASARKFRDFLRADVTAPGWRQA